MDQIYSTTDLKNRFRNNVINTIVADMHTNASVPAPIPAADLQGNNINDRLNNVTLNSNTTVSASEVYKALMTVMKLSGNIRKYHINTYFNNNGNNQLQSQAEGKAAFNDTLSANTDSLNKSTTTGKQNYSDVNNPLVAGNETKLAELNSFFSNLLSAWKTLYNNTITYNYYTCHSSCHNNCHSSGRGRR